MSEDEPRVAVVDILLTEYGRAPGAVVQEILDKTASNAASYDRLMDKAVDRAAARVRNEVREGLRVALTTMFEGQPVEPGAIEEWIEIIMRKDLGL